MECLGPWPPLLARKTVAFSDSGLPYTEAQVINTVEKRGLLCWSFLLNQIDWDSIWETNVPISVSDEALLPMFRKAFPCGELHEIWFRKVYLDRTKLASPFEHNLHSSPERFLEYYGSTNFLFWSSLLASQFELLRLQNPPLISHFLLRACGVAVIELFFPCNELTSSQAAFKDFVASFNSSLTDICLVLVQILRQQFLH